MLHWKVKFVLLAVSAAGLAQLLGAVRFAAGFAW
jgi:hypothetical protein